MIYLLNFVWIANLTLLMGEFIKYQASKKGIDRNHPKNPSFTLKTDLQNLFNDFNSF